MFWKSITTATRHFGACEVVWLGMEVGDGIV